MSSRLSWEMDGDLFAFIFYGFNTAILKTFGMVETNRHLPRYVALTAFLVYVLTLSRSITLQSLPLTAQLAGWDWLPMTGHPLLWLLTLPLRLLPDHWIPIGLNLFSAACGALTLGLLARSIQLLPRDLAENANNDWVDNLSVMLACVVCGLEFNFWQEATAATGEMLDILLLAAAIRCLLEYRTAKKSGWVNAAAFFWGLGMAENWAMLITLPLFVASLIWLRGMRFFKVRFLLRMALLGLAGFSIYALLPLVNGMAPHSPWKFGEAWHMTLRTTKHIIMNLRGRFWVAHRSMGFAVLVYYLVPTLPCLVRLRHERIQKESVKQFQMWIYRAMHAVLLVACLRLAFDPAFGLRQIVMRQLNIPLPLLSFDYFNALGVGFLAMNLLLFFQGSHSQGRFGLRWWAKRMAAPALVIMLGLMTVGLIARNIAAVTLANRHPLQVFGDLAVRSLPTEGGMVLSDDPRKLAVFQAALSRHNNHHQWLPVDTQSLPSSKYRARLERKFPSGWLTDTNQHELDSNDTLQLLDEMARTHRIFYLHPSFGYFFEQFYLQPCGTVYEMKRLDKDRSNEPPLSLQESDQVEKFWDEVWETELEPVSQLCSERHSSRTKIQKPLFRYFQQDAIPSYQSRLLGEWYSAAIDDWGVKLQRNGRLPEARRRFEQAISLNTNNMAALINLQCNTNLQAGNKMNLAWVSQVTGRIGNLQQRLVPLLNFYGPFDDPVFCYLLGSVYSQAGLLRQATMQFERAKTLAPGVPAPELALAQIYSRQRMDNKVIETVNRIRQETQTSPARDTLDVGLSMLEANSWLSQTNPVQARSVLESVLKQHPNDARTRDLVLQAYLTIGDFTNALNLLTGQLEKEPDDVSALINQAGILIQMGKGANAIPLLNRALDITNTPLARFNRAAAYMQIQNFHVAEAEYLELQKALPKDYRVHYGLAEIAQYRHETNLVIHHLELCLSNEPSGTPKWKKAREWLDSLKTASRKH